MKSKFFKAAALFVTAVIVLLCVFIIGRKSTEPVDPEPVIITQSVLQEIIETSSISTFESVYNGIAQVYNEKKPLEIDYYVSYEATVKVGFDLSEMTLSVDTENKTVTVELPPMEITQITVDIASLDFIFINDKVNKSSVSAKAFEECKADADRACRYQPALYELGSNNAKKCMEALIKPFVESIDPEYSIIINQEAVER